MILNALSIIMIFIGILSFFLMIWGGISAFSLYKRWGKTATPEEKTLLEDRSYLVLLIFVIVLVIRLINWPFFYATLQSFISDVEGAMCIHGVTQVRPGLTRFLEFLKPINFFLIGGWFILHHFDRTTKTSPLMRRKLLLLSIIGLFVLADSFGDIFLILRISPGTLVSCCTTITDISTRPTRTTPESLLGPQYAQYLKILYFITHLTLIGFITTILKTKKLEDTFSWRRRVLGISFFFALLNASLFLLSQIEVFGPSMMRLPFHHCLYCLWQYVPDSTAMFALFALGTFSVGWGFTTELIGKYGEAKDLLPAYLGKIYTYALIFLSASLIMLLIHMLVD